MYCFSKYHFRMRFLFCFISLFFISVARAEAYQSSWSNIKSSTSPDDQQAAVADLLKRVIKDRALDFVVNVDPTISSDGKDAFQLESLDDGKVKITGTTGVAVAAGFNHYLKYYCNSQIAWQTTHLNLPTPLPTVKIKVYFNDRFRYYQNVCTTSYSFVWWDWKQWEKHIDWMALNSFNLVLAFNGQEAIWQRVYKNLNLTQQDIDENFSGPAFLAWLRMGNMRGFAGPLSDAWHTKSLTLQKQILNRMRQLGIIPVLPAFAGHLPRAFKRLYPHVRMSQMGTWNHFEDKYCCPYFLDPTEILFNTIGTLFITEQIAEYGTDHVYNCDSFNENTPTSGSLIYLHDVGRSIYKAMADVDPDAIWIMQNWLFVNAPFFWTKDRAKALLTSVPIGKMIVLDLQSELAPKYELLDQYFGQPYIWCMLHNFGGTLGMFGSSEVINEAPIAAREMENSTMIGIGLTPEGINQNYVIYDLMIENAWRKESVNLSTWFDLYSVRRYGKSNQFAIKAWQLLQKSVYNSKGWRNHGKYIVVMRPTLRLAPRIWYNPSDIMEAWNNLLQANVDLKHNEGYLYDLTDLTRQVLQVHGAKYYKRMVKAFKRKNSTELEASSLIFIQIQLDLEEILASNKNFLLGNWIESAKALASTSQEEEQFEFNARNQVTLWGPNGEISDYAIKQWSGIIQHYTFPRWQLFIEYMKSTLANNEAFNQTYIQQTIFKQVDEPFTKDRTVLPTTPTGDTVNIADAIHQSPWIINNWTVIDKTYRRQLQRRRLLRNPTVILYKWLDEIS